MHLKLSRAFTSYGNYRMSTLWRKAPKSSEEPLVEVNAGEVTLERPTVIFLTGVSTTVKQPKFVSGSLSHVNEMLDSAGPGLSAKTDVMAWSYQSKRKNFMSVFSYNANPQGYFSKTARKFVDDFLLPHMNPHAAPDRKGQLIIAGENKPIAETQRAFNNLTLLAYSYGSVFAQEVYNASRARMRELGYTDRQSKLLMSRIHQISLGAVSRPMQEQDRYSSICMVATNDRISNHKRRIWWSVGELFAAYAQKLTIKSLSKRSLYISAPVQKDLWEEKTGKDGKVEKRNINHLFPKWWVRASHHELPHYTTNQDHSNAFARIARYALINSVTREKTLRPEQMIAPPASLRQPGQCTPHEIQAYEARIAKGIRRGKKSISL